MRETHLTAGAQPRVYQKESDELHCPICGQKVDYLCGEDEEGRDPNRGRMGCETCWRPPLVKSKDVGPGAQTDLLTSLQAASPASEITTLQGLINEAK